MKNILLIILITKIISISDCYSQYVNNPSFEGPTGLSATPPGWMKCHDLSTPDTGPAVNGVYKTASHGNTYLILVARGQLGPYARTTEDCKAPLLKPLLVGNCYKFSIDISFTENYGHDSWEYGYISYGNPVKLRVYGAADGNCSDTVLLYETGPVSNEDWITHEFFINPVKDFNYLILKCDYASLPEYFGNIELDNIHLDVIKNPDTLLLETTINYGESVQLNASGGASYSWSPDTGLSCTDCPNPIASPPYSFVYTVVINSESVCYRRTEHFWVEVFPFIPNIITPNYDGKNDKFEIKGLVPQNHIEITDRWGKTLFEMDNYDNSWDGIYEGNILPPDSYWYLLKCIQPDRIYKGFINVKF